MITSASSHNFVEQFSYFENGYPSKLLEMAKNIAENICEQISNRKKNFTGDVVVQRIHEDAISFAKPLYYSIGHIVLNQAVRFIEDESYKELMNLLEEQKKQL